MGQCHHYSAKVRLKALQGLLELATEYPAEVTSHAHEVVSITSDRATDPDKACRNAYCAFLRNAFFPAVGKTALRPFIPLLMGHICSSMTHLSHQIRDSGIKLMQVVLEWRPDVVAEQYFLQVAQHFLDALSRSSRGRSISAGSLKTLGELVNGLHSFLVATLPHVQVSTRGLVTEPQSRSTEIFMPNPLLCWRKGLWNPSGHKGGNLKSEINTEDDDYFSSASKLLGLLLEGWEECGLCTNSVESRSVTNIDSISALDCGCLIIQCCIHLISCFGIEISGDPIVTSTHSHHILTRIYPFFPAVDKALSKNGIREIDTAAAELAILILSRVDWSSYDGRENSSIGGLEGLADWCKCCVAETQVAKDSGRNPYAIGISLSKSILCLLNASDSNSLLESIYRGWKACPSSSQNKKRGLELLRSMLEPPLLNYDPFQDISNQEKYIQSNLQKPRMDNGTDVIISNWLSEIPSLLWREKAGNDLELYRLGVGSLLNATRFLRGPQSIAILPKTRIEIENLASKISPLFAVKVNGKLVPGPLVKKKMECLQTLTVDLMFQLPGLHNQIIKLVQLCSLEVNLLPLPIIGRMFELIQFKSQFGDPEEVWNLIYSALHGNDAAQKKDQSITVQTAWDYHCTVVERASQVALHCSPVDLAIQAILPALLKEREASQSVFLRTRIGYGALLFLRKALRSMNFERYPNPEVLSSIQSRLGSALVSICVEMYSDCIQADIHQAVRDGIQDSIVEILKRFPAYWPQFVVSCSSNMDCGKACPAAVACVLNIARQFCDEVMDKKSIQVLSQESKTLSMFLESVKKNVKDSQIVYTANHILVVLNQKTNCFE